MLLNLKIKNKKKGIQRMLQLKGGDDKLRVGNSEQDKIKNLLQSFCKHLWAEAIAGEDISRLQNLHQS